MVSENKTKPTGVKVGDFLQAVSDQRRAEAETLIGMMRRISGDEPVMWGPSIIGFGTRRYETTGGRAGDIGRLGFSPRKAALTIYFYEGFDRYSEELRKLGKHKTSRACLYINKLADIDLVVLESMLCSSYETATDKADTPDSVGAYIASVPQAARTRFDELREIVRTEIPNAHEVTSYGIIGYKSDINRRAKVFISGWKDHVAVYPIPKNEVLRKELEPYIKGKGTLWFKLDGPLPIGLIQKVVRELY